MYDGVQLAGNYDQFCRVLDELVLHTTTPYISVETVRDQLKRECTFYPRCRSPNPRSAR